MFWNSHKVVQPSPPSSSRTFSSAQNATSPRAVTPAPGLGTCYADSPARTRHKWSQCVPGSSGRERTLPWLDSSLTWTDPALPAAPVMPSGHLHLPGSQESCCSEHLGTRFHGDVFLFLRLSWQLPHKHWHVSNQRPLPIRQQPMGLPSPQILISVGAPDADPGCPSAKGVSGGAGVRLPNAWLFVHPWKTVPILRSFLKWLSSYFLDLFVVK